jgi:gamma-glutamyltranspeptidase/glutathione hydrolase
LSARRDERADVRSQKHSAQGFAVSSKLVQSGCELILVRSTPMPKHSSALSPNLSLKRIVRKPSARSKGGIVVSQHRIASEIGARVLKEGGNAIDAAVATSFAVGVVEPWMSGIGGVGALIHRDAKTGKVTCVDFGGRSPKGLKLADFPLAGGNDVGNLFGWPAVKGNVNNVGPKALVAPTHPAGIEMAHKLLGTKRWKDLVAPAVKLAEDGMVVDWYTMATITNALSDLQKDAGCRERFLRNNLPPAPQPPQAGLAHIRLPAAALARTIQAIASDGAKVMYEGALARSIAEDVQALGGYLTTDDLAAVKPVEREPLKQAYGNRVIHGLPELTGGPTMALAFQHLAKHGGTPGAAPDGARFVAYAKALDHAWQDRFRRMGDAGERSLPTSTTHLSVVDRHGNVVALTQTLLSLFGSRVLLPTSGILMNNGINWFDPRPDGPNGLGPDRRGLSNYVPTIMTGGDEVVGIGGCGGRRILPAVFQLCAMIADFRFDLDRAFHEPRIDVSGGAGVSVDRRLPAATRAAIEAAFDVVDAEPVPMPMPFTIAGAVRHSAAGNEAATEPEQPWSEAVSEEEV